jgi:hypothetical protein
MQRHLVHVGYPKAGSTTLQAWFESRPEVVFADDAIGGVTSAAAIARQVAVTDSAASDTPDSTSNRVAWGRALPERCQPPQSATT